MSTAFVTAAVQSIDHGGPHLIRSEKQLAEYTAALFALTAKKKITRAESETIDLLTLLIETYEQEHFPIAEADAVDVLRLLMESHNLSQKDLAPEFGSESTVSMVLSGKRQMNRQHIARLAARFRVSPAVFF